MRWRDCQNNSAGEVNQVKPEGLIAIKIGLLIILAGGFLYFFGGKIPLGRLPGDFRFKGENFSFYFPLTTCLIINLLLYLLFKLFR
jgi:hypothetical protein